MRKFENDDLGFKKWFDGNGHKGYILNLPNEAMKTNLKGYMLHHTNCNSIPPKKQVFGEGMTNNFYKWWDLDKNKLITECVKARGVKPNICKKCKP